MTLIILMLLKYPYYLTIVYNQLSWLFGFLYARFKTYSINVNSIEQRKNTLSKQLYFRDINNSLNIIDYCDVKNSTSDKYYLRFTNKNGIEKILVFNDKLKLMNQYNELLDKFEKDVGHFSTLLEAIVNNEDVSALINKYLDGKNNYYDITGYRIKYLDIYDFDSNSFLLETKDEIRVLDMTLNESKHFFNDLIIFNNC